jgi:antitoxin ParD1/3/4
MSKTMKEFVDEQVERLGYGTASEYVESLVRADRKQLEEKILEGINCPVRIEVTSAFWHRKKEELKAKFAKPVARKRKAVARR